MTRIAVIYLGNRGSGGPISLALGQALHARGAQVAAFLSEGLETLPAWKKTPFPFTALPTFSEPLGYACGQLFGVRLNAVATAIRAFQPDLLLFPMDHPWNAVLQARLSPVRSIVFVHDPRPRLGLVGWLQATLENISLRRAAACLVLSQSLIPALVQRGVKREAVVVAPHGMLFYPDIAPSHVSSGMQRVLFFGRIEPYKGLDILLNAFAQLQNHWPKASLIIAGEGDLQPYRALLARIKNVEVIEGWIPEREIPHIFGRASLLALPYTSASQSGVIAIAAGFGLPVVTTRTGGLVEQVRHGITGLLVEPGSADALAVGIDRVLADSELARRLGTGLRQDFLHRQSWDLAAEIVLRLGEAPQG